MNNKKNALPNAKSYDVWSKCIFLASVALGFTSCRINSDSSREILDRSHLKILKNVPVKEESDLFNREYKPVLPRTCQKSLAPLLPLFMKKIISISITEDVPLKEAFIKLASQAGASLQLDPKINERIIFSANKRPLIEVIQDICSLADLRYTISPHALKIEVDIPYSQTHNVQFLNLVRTTENRISIGTDVFSNHKDRQSSVDNGSNSSIVGKGQTDFWTELDSNLKTMLGLLTASDDQPAKLPSYSIHRQAGLIIVQGTSRQHKMVKEYLASLRQTTSTQVLIEAKIIEVTLKDQYKSGINWQKLMNGDLNMNMSFGNLAQRSRFLNPASAQTDMLTFGMQGKSFSTLIKAIEEFGMSRTLSSPRLTVLNNHTAILKVAQNLVYFRLNYEKQLNLSGNRESINVYSDIQTTPVGLVMSVHPAIDHDTGEVILSLRPTISRLAESVSDPAVDLAFQATKRDEVSIQQKPSLVPVIEVREIESVLRLPSGQMAVLGGLMETRSISGTTKLPVVGDLPMIGQLFTASADGEEVVELVILLRASIIDSAPAPDAADERLYQNYADDPRITNRQDR